MSQQARVHHRDDSIAPPGPRNAHPRDLTADLESSVCLRDGDGLDVISEYHYGVSCWVELEAHRNLNLHRPTVARRQRQPKRDRENDWENHK